jgi:hypothetical protein
MMVKLNNWTTKSLEVSHATFICKDLTSEDSSSLSSVSTNRPEVQQYHRGDEIHTNVRQCTNRSRGFVY